MQAAVELITTQSAMFCHLLPDACQKLQVFKILYFVLVISELTYNVTSGTLNPTIPIPIPLYLTEVHNHFSTHLLPCQ